MNAVELTAALVAIDSRNPSLVSGAPGERGVARFLAEILRSWSFEVSVIDVAGDRPNVVARAGRGEGLTLMLNGHLDVVGTESMSHAPFQPTIDGGRLFGRGAADMKSGIAAMCIAARDAVAAGIAGEVVLALVIDEEYESLGTRALVESGVRADAAIITEPTRLAIMPAHRGFVWARLDVQGRAAHGSRYDIGVDAISGAASILASLERVQREVLVNRTHPLLGRASLHASSIGGGEGFSTYPARCTLEIERRTIPGEDADTFRRELEHAIGDARAAHPGLDVAVEMVTSQLPSDVSEDAAIVRALKASLQSNAMEARIEGMSAWTDAAILNAAGIPAICFGPGDISLAHAATEYVPVEEIASATSVLTTLVREWCA